MNARTTKTKTPHAIPPPLGLYLRIARQVLPSCPPAERVEVLKGACARLHVPYSSVLIREAVDTFDGPRVAPPLARPKPQTTHAAPGIDDAAAVLARLGVEVPALAPLKAGTPSRRRAWVKVERPTRCGGCGRVSDVGAPVLMLTVADDVQKPRCVDCAGEPSPEHVIDVLGAGPDPTSRADRVEAVRRRAYARLSQQPALDVWPDREPGEDG